MDGEKDELHEWIIHHWISQRLDCGWVDEYIQSGWMGGGQRVGRWINRWIDIKVDG